MVIEAGSYHYGAQLDLPNLAIETKIVMANGRHRNEKLNKTGLF